MKIKTKIKNVDRIALKMERKRAERERQDAHKRRRLEKNGFDINLIILGK